DFDPLTEISRAEGAVVVRAELAACARIDEHRLRPIERAIDERLDRGLVEGDGGFGHAESQDGPRLARFWISPRIDGDPERRGGERDADNGEAAADRLRPEIVPGQRGAGSHRAVAI